MTRRANHEDELTTRVRGRLRTVSLCCYAGAIYFAGISYPNSYLKMSGLIGGWALVATLLRRLWKTADRPLPSAYNTALTTVALHAIIDVAVYGTWFLFFPLRFLIVFLLIRGSQMARETPVQQHAARARQRAA